MSNKKLTPSTPWVNDWADYRQIDPDGWLYEYDNDPRINLPSHIVRMEKVGCGYDSEDWMDSVEERGATKASMTTPKLRWSLLTVDMRRSLELVARVMDHGATKYGVRDWQKGGPEFLSHLKDARERHWTAHLSGELLDADSGLPHMAHIVASDLMILELEVLA